MIERTDITHPASTEGAPDASGFFGESSRPATGEALLYGFDPATTGAAGTVGFGIAVLAIIFFYYTILYRFRAQLSWVVAGGLNRSDMEKALGGRNRLFDLLIRLVLLLGAGALAVSVIRAAETGAADAVSRLAPRETAAWCAGVFAVIIAVWEIQSGLLYAVGKTTLSPRLTSDINNIRRLGASMASIVIVPLAVMSAMADGIPAMVLGGMIAITLATVCVVLLTRTYRLFVERNVSIFYWFLYLCAVELFPASLPILLFLRYIQ